MSIDRQTIRLNLAVDTNPRFSYPNLLMDNISKINYPVKIHKAGSCTCNRIQNKISQTKIKEGQKIVYILEKKWNDSEYEQFPNIIFITDNINNTNDNNADLMLYTLFQDSIPSRNLVKKYFNQYKWSLQTSISVRSIVNSMTTVCLCKDDLLLNKTTCNAGFIIVGSENQMKSISHCFNKYCQKTEFTKSFIIKLSNLHMVDKNQMGHTLDVFSKSKEKKLLDPSFYTLVGEETKDKKSDSLKYCFPFGKREWFYGKDETSFECAKRELYEELNIQFSENLWTQSQTSNQPQYIHRPGIMLFFLYLPHDTSVTYHNESDTIYLK